MSTNSRIYLSPPHLAGREAEYVMDAIRSNWIAPAGPDIAAFETELAAQTGTAYAAGVSSGTAAMHLCLRFLNVAQGDVVFCSDLTFAGSCNPILYQNAEPVFIDSEPGTWNMSPAALGRAFEAAQRSGQLPKAVIIVDLYGQAASYDELLEICRHYGTPVIEDAAEALGASYRGRPCGSLGRFGCFSFNGNKIITTSGGGMIVSDDRAAIERMKFLATQAKLPLPYYEHEELGYNYRLSNICAALGRGQLEGLAAKVHRRAEIFSAYREAFLGLPLTMLPVSAQGAPNYWLSVALLDEGAHFRPTDIIDALERENIESRRVWKPMHLQPLYRQRRFFAHDARGGGDSVSAAVFDRGICLPSGSGMTPEQQQRIIDIVRALFPQP
ncbi:MAG: DegT/DnrJ/EryC1/StrS family aminotransferase [Clostridia bacterium]|nr:DegT/DnrJ/EryC1/StrS family aminotransferase [Clostridia bacterium]